MISQHQQQRTPSFLKLIVSLQGAGIICPSVSSGTDSLPKECTRGNTEPTSHTIHNYIKEQNILGTVKLENMEKF